MMCFDESNLYAPGGTEGPGGSHFPAFISSPGHQGRSQTTNKCEGHLQEELEGGSRELQSCHSDLSPREAYGTDYFECNHATLTGKPGDQALSA